MKKIIIKSAGLVFLLSATAFADLASAASVYFDFDGDMLADANPQVVDFIQPITADIYIDGIDTSHGGLVGFGLNISYDPLVVSHISSNLSPIWLALPSTITSGNLLLEGLAILGQPAPAGTIPLASVTFLGTEAFTLSLWGKSPITQDFSGVDGFNYDPAITFQSAAVSAVPLPGAVLLLGSGLLGLAGLRKKSKS